MFEKLKKLFHDEKKGSAEEVPIKAETCLDVVVSGNESVALKKKGNEYLARGMLDEASECYQKAVTLNADFAEGYLNLGFVFKAKGNIGLAEINLSKALALDPRLVDALFILGEIKQEKNCYDEALSYYYKLLDVNPVFEPVYRNLSALFVSLGQLDKAILIVEQALRYFPDNVELNFNYGDLQQREGKLDAAIKCFERVLELDKGYYPAWVHLGNALKDQGNLLEARSAYEKAIGIAPNIADAYNNLGALFHDLGDQARAEMNYLRAIEAQPNFSEAYNNLGGVYNFQGKFNEAIKAFQKALALKPDAAAVLNNLGLAYRNRGNFSEAETTLKKSIEFDPSCVDAYNNLGSVLYDQERFDEAQLCYDRLLEINPNFSLAYLNKGALFQATGDFTQALNCFEKLKKLEPAWDFNTVNLFFMRMFFHEWKDLGQLCDEARKATKNENIDPGKNVMQPFSFVAIPGATAEEHYLCAKKSSDKIILHTHQLRSLHEFKFVREKRNEIRLGYYSADFRNHPVAHLMAPIFRLHDRDRFRVYAYSVGPNDDTGMRDRMRDSFESFHDLRGFSDIDVATKIAEDKIDILINLTGYTQHGRAEIMALRPAPIQVNYLGYPGTMGGEFSDYIIADEFIIPLDAEKFYSEKVLRLPHCYMPRDDAIKRYPKPSRLRWGLPEDAFVFCSFNQPYKINPQMFDIWCRLLKAVPGSVLWLPSIRPAAELNLAQEARVRGVEPERIIRAGRAELMEDHLARIQCADLFLDTTPFNGHTTCSDALWMGLPVVTCVGETFPARVAGSLLHAMGLDKLITYNLEDYFSLALALASDKEKYQQTREKVLSARDTAPMFNSALFTADLEALYVNIWEDYLQGEH